MSIYSMNVSVDGLSPWAGRQQAVSSIAERPIRSGRFFSVASSRMDRLFRIDAPAE